MKGKRGLIMGLANDRSLGPQGVRGLSPETAAILYNWYRDGYVHSGVA